MVNFVMSYGQFLMEYFLFCVDCAVMMYANKHIPEKLPGNPSVN